MDASSDFETFWAAYPKKRSKGQARKAWNKLKPSAALLQKMLDALAWQSQQYDWVKNQRQYAPYPATYLNGEMWLDEPPKQIGIRQWTCPHDPHCGSHYQCHLKIEIEKHKASPEPQEPQ